MPDAQVVYLSHRRHPRKLVTLPFPTALTFQLLVSQLLETLNWQMERGAGGCAAIRPGWTVDSLGYHNRHKHFLIDLFLHILIRKQREQWDRF